VSRKRKWNPLYLALAVLLGVATPLVLLYKVKPATAPMADRQTGYKTEDRQKLEQLIHKGTQND
jgi:hypothetical protein